MFLRGLCVFLVVVFALDRIPIRRVRRSLLDRAILYEQSCLNDLTQIEQDPEVTASARAAAQARLNTARAYRRTLEAGSLTRARRLFAALFPDRGDWRED
ncbi:MAG: hypothetical protein NVSMB65_20920 [Chloroflexota bacterium]